MKKCLIAIFLLGVLAGCGAKDETQYFRSGIKGLPEPTEYFPLQAGDTWYYTFQDEQGTRWVVKREVDPNAEFFKPEVIADCTPILENGVVFECWSKSSSAFTQNVIGVRLYPNPSETLDVSPPLKIPFDLRSDEPYEFNSLAVDNISPSIQFQIAGTLTFRGYVTKTVAAGTFKNCIALEYVQKDTDGSIIANYFEYYAPGLGLLDNGDIVLDSATIGGVRYGM